MLYPSAAVPPPRVDVTTLPGSGPFYAGSALTLRCAVDIDLLVDIPYMITVMWLKSGRVIGNNERTTISNVTQLSSSMHETSLGLRPLSSTSDTGTYTCQVAVNSISSQFLVLGANQADMETVNVQGNYNLSNYCGNAYGICIEMSRNWNRKSN